MNVVYIDTKDECPSHKRDWEKIKKSIPDLRFVKSYFDADVFIVYLCAMAEHHFNEVRSILYSIKNTKMVHPNVKIFVGGCATSLDCVKAVLDEYKDMIDAVFSKTNMAEVVLRELSLEESKQPTFFIRNFTANIPISIGCMKRCSFCKTNYLASNYLSVPTQQILDEVGDAVQKGILHICLVGENTTEYGRDYKDGTNLELLIKKIFEKYPMVKIMDIMELTLDEINDSLLESLISEPRIQSLQAQVQSFSQEVRDKMNLSAKADRAKYVYEKLCKYKDVSSDIIVGHPGETQENFEETLKYIKDTNAWTLGVIPLEPTPGTKCFDMDRPTDEEKANRKTILEDTIFYLKKSYVDKLTALEEPIKAYVCYYNERMTSSICKMIGQPLYIEVPGIHRLYDEVNIFLKTPYVYTGTFRGTIITD